MALKFVIMWGSIPYCEEEFANHGKDPKNVTWWRQRVTLTLDWWVYYKYLINLIEPTTNSFSNLSSKQKLSHFFFTKTSYAPISLRCKNIFSSCNIIIEVLSFIRFDRNLNKFEIHHQSYNISVEMPGTANLHLKFLLKILSYY